MFKDDNSSIGRMNALKSFSLTFLHRLYLFEFYTVPASVNVAGETNLRNLVTVIIIMKLIIIFILDITNTSCEACSYG